MNRVSRRSTNEAADALLEVGRTQPALDYDVELGLARHHDWLRSEAPMPEWASAGAAPAAKSLVALVIKTFVSTVLIGVVATAVWQARGLLQPSAATVTVPVEAAAPSTEALATTEAPMPIPVPEQALPSDQPVRRVVRDHDKRTARIARAHKESAARAVTVPVEQPEPVAAVSVQTTAPAAIRTEVAPAATERKPSNVAQRPRPETQAPNDLAEMQQVATAEQLLERSPGRALALVQQGDQRFARGYFQQERAYIAIMALIRLGRTDEARTKAASFDKQFPAKPYGARIRSALEAAQ